MYDQRSAETWTPELVDMLTRLWREGHSATDCARKLGGGITRSAVIGKVHRLKLPKRSTLATGMAASRHQKTPGKPGRPRKQAAETAPAPVRATRKPRTKGQPKANAITHRLATTRRPKGGLMSRLGRAREMGLGLADGMAAVLGRGVVSFDDEGVDVTHMIGFEQAVDAHGCLWCSGDPRTAHHSFCGKPRRPGTRWCPEHYARVYSGRPTGD